MQIEPGKEAAKAYYFNWNFSQLCKNQQRCWYWYWFHWDQSFPPRKQLWWLLGYLVVIFFSLCISHSIKPHLRTLHPCSSNELGKDSGWSPFLLSEPLWPWWRLGTARQGRSAGGDRSPTISTPGLGAQRRHRQGVQQHQDKATSLCLLRGNNLPRQ